MTLGISEAQNGPVDGLMYGRGQRPVGALGF